MTTGTAIASNEAVKSHLQILQCNQHAPKQRDILLSRFLKLYVVLGQQEGANVWKKQVVISNVTGLV